MYLRTFFSFLALAGSVTLTSAVPFQAAERDVAAPPETGDTMTIKKCAELPRGMSYNDSSVQWEDCHELDARREKRAIVCKRDPANCVPPCYVSSTQEITLNGKGTWWTRWCHAGGLHTQNKGSLAWVSVGHSTTVTWSGELSLAGPVGNFLGAKIGRSVSSSRSISQGLGCVNQDGQPHSVWLREQMGWADTTVVTTVKQTGGGCEKPGTNKYTSKVHADFPDPNNTGYRDLLAGCGSPDDGQGPWCNLDAPSLNRD